MAMLPNYVYWNYLPGGFEFGYGDSTPANRFPGRHFDLYLHLSNIMDLYADEQPLWAGAAASVRDMVGGSYSIGSRIPFFLLRGCAYDAVEPVSPDEFHLRLPLARYFEGMGQTFMRSGRGEDDTYALFAAGGSTRSHKHYDANHFTIYRRGFLALDTGPRRGYPEILTNYTSQTIAHNCVLIKMPGEPPSYYAGVPRDQAGGQNRQVGSRVVAFETNPYYSYVAGDAAPVYHEDKCAMMVRQFLFFPPGHFLVFDRVVSVDPDFEKTWLLHHAGEPVFDGRTWHADQGRGRLFSRTLLPEDARIEAVGGPGREFEVEGVNYPLKDSDLVDGEVPELLGRWRVEVKPGAPRAEDVFLHLLQAGGLELERMGESEVRTLEDGTVEVRFNAHGREVAARLRKTGAVGGHVRITEGGLVLVDGPLTEDIERQSGLAVF